MTKKIIRFGTDGWRDIIADRFTFENLDRVAGAAAVILEEVYGNSGSKVIAVGYDRRFLSKEFAQCAAESIARLGYQVYLAHSFSSTPSMSWAAFIRGALGAIVITASHNPPLYSGLKIKGAFGGSVSEEVTQKVEQLLEFMDDDLPAKQGGEIIAFDPWESYIEVLRTKVDIAKIQTALRSDKLLVLANVMHGSLSTGLGRVLGDLPGLIEVNGNSDPMFGGLSPEPIPKYLTQFFEQIKTVQSQHPATIVVGLVFDGDGDRIAAVDGQGNYLSSQTLIPVLIEHLHLRHGLNGEIIKTLSGSDLIPKIASLYGLGITETPIGYKYIAEKMLSGKPILLGGEESGGIGYGNHIPERDALLSALYILETIASTGQNISTLYSNLQTQVNFTSHYDRIDLTLPSEGAREIVIHTLQQNPPHLIADRGVLSMQTLDGFKLRLEGDSWLLIRFSGTEPVLRLYCEAPTPIGVKEILTWIETWVNSLVNSTVQASPKPA